VFQVLVEDLDIPILTKVLEIARDRLNGPAT
jgi:hypothetical protein